LSIPITKANCMTDEQTPADSPTNPAISPTDEVMLDIMDMADIAVGKQGQTTPRKVPTGKKANPTKKGKSPTLKQGAGLNKIKQDELVKWTVFVQKETKTAVGKAAHKAAVTITDWVDSRLREVATSELTTKPKPPARTADVADLMTQLENRLADKQAAQIEQLAQTIKQSNENRPSNLKEWLFGKPKQG
jgi:hypothetical protein